MNAEANILLFPYLQLYLLSTGSDKGCEQDGRTGRSCGTEDSIETRGNQLSALHHFSLSCSISLRGNGEWLLTQLMLPQKAGAAPLTSG